MFTEWFKEKLAGKPYSRWAVENKLQPATVRSWVVGKTLPQYDSIVKLAEIFGISTQELTKMVRDEWEHRKGAKG